MTKSDIILQRVFKRMLKAPISIDPLPPGTQLHPAEAMRIGFYCGVGFMSGWTKDFTFFKKPSEVKKKSSIKK